MAVYNELLGGIMSTKVERRSYAIRAAEGEEFQLVGRAVTYGALSSHELAPGLRERIVAGAFSECLRKGDDVICLFNHQMASTLPLGRLANKTLTISDRPEGLDFRVQLDKANSFHQQVYASVKRGDISECSFGFVAEAEDYSDERAYGSNVQVRNVRKATIIEISLTPKPFYGDGATGVNARSVGNGNADVEAKRQWLANQQADWTRQERAHEIGMAILRDIQLTEKRGNEDLVSMREKLQTALGMKCTLVGHKDDYVYAIDAEDEDDAFVYRFDYDQDEDGNPVVDEDSCRKYRYQDVDASAVRSDVLYFAFHERELRASLRSSAGISTR